MATPTSRKNGSPFMLAQPSRCGKTESGTYTDVPYEGVTEPEARKLSILAESNGILYDWESTFGKHTITLHYPYNFRNGTPANEPPVDLWELDQQDVDKSILDSANPLANACTQAELYLLGLFQQNKSDYIIVPDDDTSQPTNQTGTIAYPETVYDAGQSSQKRLSIATGSVARTLADLLAIGVESYPVTASTLKHTRTVNSLYPIRTPFMNVGAIISTDSIYQLENIPNNVLFDLPNQVDPAPALGKPVLSYGWRKKPPTNNQIARLKFQICETWEYGLWPIAVYGTPL